MTQEYKFNFYIDRGGTFTDIYAEIIDSSSQLAIKILKLLSEDPANYSDAPREAIRRVLHSILKRDEFNDPFKPFPASAVDFRIDTIRMGTTVATNALLERKGVKFALMISKGFRDLLEIAYQNRPKIFELDIHKPEKLYTAVVEVDERIDAQGNLIKALDLIALELQLKELLDRGIYSLAVVLMHSYKFPEHEQQIAKLAYSLGFTHVSVSSDVMPMIKIVPRGDTACVDAYLSPLIKNYVDNFKAGFSDRLENTELLFMKSDAGLAQGGSFRGYNSILSGPAAGVVGYASIHNVAVENLQSKLIGFDMGGTSTDISRFAGDYELSYAAEISGLRIQSPQLDIRTVAAGGGSRLFYENGMFRVGPESSGAHPGPVSYRKGGYLSITDANLILGRLVPEYFPKVFGVNADEPLDKASALKAFEKLKAENNLDLSIEDIALGFIKVANEEMARPIREISVMKGYDIKDHVLVCFGGAGAQHACDLARGLGITKVYIHRYSGILSAYGLSLADEVIEKQKPVTMDVEHNGLTIIERGFQELINGLDLGENDRMLKYLNLRYQGTNTNFMVVEPNDKDYIRAFKERYLREFGFDLQDRKILVDDLRIRVVKHAQRSSLDAQHVDIDTIAFKPIANTKTYFGLWMDTPVYLYDQLGVNQNLEGPAIVMQDTATILIEPNSSALINEAGDMVINVRPSALSIESSALSASDPIQLAIFSNRFMSIAEQMGRALERTSISTNIKERLDFSCAIFDREGNLVANAPHQPVHLGSMGHAVQKQIEFYGYEGIKSGDSILTNHPSMGGSHLPDMTVITPVFNDNEVIFFVANRAHHADIGGITPGSMPSFSRSLSEEGIAIKSFKLVSATKFQEEALRELFKDSRIIEDNISDLRAQVAANNKGIELIQDLIKSYSLKLVLEQMQAIQENAEAAVRKLLKDFSMSDHLTASDYLDDGSEIKLKVSINKEDGSAVFDFSGTSAQLESNLNTPPAVTSSAVLYALRCMINKEIPLNQGCLKPIKIIIPEGSLLNPSEDAAVVGGNVQTSQRIVDVIFKAFGTSAASQGCMNNISFGKEDSGSFGYYETIGGGTGAGPSWHGASGVHTHMTNTRITDPEILETRYPVILQEFSIRKGSGGLGEYNGGNGLIRVLQFLDDLNLSILTERRIYAPYGMAGGESGAKGENWLEHIDGTKINLGAKNQVKVSKGDRLIIKTPGGGGYGIKRPS